MIKFNSKTWAEEKDCSRRKAYTWAVTKKHTYQRAVDGMCQMKRIYPSTIRFILCATVNMNSRQWQVLTRDRQWTAPWCCSERRTGSRVL